MPVAAHAAARFREAGVLILKEFMPPDQVEALGAEYARREPDPASRLPEADVTQVGDQRYMLSLDVAGAFAAPDIFAHPVALSLAGEILGSDFILGSYVAVTSLPGSKMQRLHTDQEGLFGDAELDAAVPPYCITLVIPLVGLNGTTGSTLFFPGSHQSMQAAEAAGVAPELAVGDALLFDTRVTHGGLANRSSAPRPVIYCSYHRAWYRDVTNFRGMPPMKLTRAAFDALSEEQQDLVAWMLPENH